MTLSVCTLGSGRDAHLVNLVHGLNRQTVAPAELIVAVMQDRPYDLPETRFPIRQILLGGGGIPLAAARNTAAHAARQPEIAFLDIDCIPDPSLVADYVAHLDGRDALLMGEVQYLPAGATDDGIDYDRFADLGETHCDRAGPPVAPLGVCTDYRCFWSLNFAMQRERFVALGGFDERYSGYGGEDTDFGRVAFDAGVPFFWTRGARAYHQHHAHHMPPVHHVESVVANARAFRDKWGEWTMPHWLRCFELMGLIARDGDDYIILRAPDDRDLALTRQQSHMPYASTARVMTVLEDRAAAMAAA